MTDPAVTERDLRLLGVVAEGQGEWDARRIDLTLSARHGAGELSVLEHLRALEENGLVAQDLSRGGLGGRWQVTPSGEVYLRSH